MTPQMDWKRAGQAVMIRRAQLGYRRQDDIAELAGVGVSVWRNLENGKQDNYRGATLIVIEQALRWPPGTIMAIAGGAAIPEDAPPDIRSRLANAEDEIVQLRDTLTEVTRRLNMERPRTLADLEDEDDEAHEVLRLAADGKRPGTAPKRRRRPEPPAEE